MSEYSETLLTQSPTASRGIVWSVPEQEQREAVRAYYAAISFMDAQVGRLLDALERLGLAENTIVVFMSDHGYHIGDHGGLWMKQSLFERALRTPVIVAGHGVSARGQASRRVVELIDLYPTLSALSGIPAPGGLEGRSLSPLLSNPQADWNHPAFSQTVRAVTALGGRGGPGVAGRGGGRGGVAQGGATPPEASPQAPAAAGPGPVGAAPTNPPATGYSVRTERWRYIEWDEGRLGQELYDAIDDPGELRNLAGESFYSGAVADMKRLLAGLRAARRN